MKPNLPNTSRNLRLYFDRKFNKKTYPDLVKEYRRSLAAIWRIYQKMDKKYSHLSENELRKEVKKNDSKK